MGNNRLVFSTELGQICPECSKPVDKCTCKKISSTKFTDYPNDGIVRIWREVKGRKGKTVTIVSGISFEEKELQRFAKTLKRRCGTGGSVKDGVIIIQGDHRVTLLAEIKKHGYSVKLAGG